MIACFACYIADNTWGDEVTLEMNTFRPGSCSNWNMIRKLVAGKGHPETRAGLRRRTIHGLKFAPSRGASHEKVRLTLEPEITSDVMYFGSSTHLLPLASQVSGCEHAITPWSRRAEIHMKQSVSAQCNRSCAYSGSAVRSTIGHLWMWSLRTSLDSPLCELVTMSTHNSSAD